MTRSRKQICDKDAKEMEKFFLSMCRSVHSEATITMQELHKQQIQRQEEESEMNNGDIRLLLSDEEVQEPQQEYQECTCNCKNKRKNKRKKKVGGGRP